LDILDIGSNFFYWRYWPTE